MPAHDFSALRVELDLPPADESDTFPADVLIERADNGFTVHYAIADLGSAISPGGPVDVEARRRGQTIYLPDAAIIITEPPVEVRCLGTGLVDGSTIDVRVREIDQESRTVTYQQAVDPS